MLIAMRSNGIPASGFGDYMFRRFIKNIVKITANGVFTFIACSSATHAFADSQIGSFIYAATQNPSDGLAKFDATSLVLLKTIPLPNSTEPYVLGVDPGQSYVYVERDTPSSTLINKRTVDVISTTTDTVVRSFDLPIPSGYTGRLGNLSFSLDGSKAFILLTDAGKVLILNGDLSRQIAVVESGGSTPMNSALSPDGAWLYVSNWGGTGAIGVINTAGGVLQGTRDVRMGAPHWSDGAPGPITVSPDGKTVYVSLTAPASSGYTGELLALQPNAAYNSFDLQKHLFFPTTISSTLQITADGKKLYILAGAGGNSSNSYIVNTDTYAVSTKDFSTVNLYGGLKLTKDGNRIVAGQAYFGTPPASILSIDPAGDVVSARAPWMPVKGANSYVVSFALVNVKDPACR